MAGRKPNAVWTNFRPAQPKDLQHSRWGISVAALVIWVYSAFEGFLCQFLNRRQCPVRGPLYSLSLSLSPSSSGVSRSLHTRRWTHRSVLSHHGSRRRSSDVRSSDLQPRPCDRPRPYTRWQMGCPDTSWHHPRQPHRQRNRLAPD